ncbi:unnamed protein product [Cuscuta campestris]|uniref:Uncharacterized protein n=1 Tax=Cuscuta campestris TaxID=132261 RepID=A0A484NMD6_9ASTE|nr:unnamed protein product [Cuscuta campestris]
MSQASTHEHDNTQHVGYEHIDGHTKDSRFAPNQDAVQLNIPLNAGNNQNIGNKPDFVMRAFMENFLQQMANAPMFQPLPSPPPCQITFKILKDNGAEEFLGDRIRRGRSARKTLGCNGSHARPLGHGAVHGTPVNRWPGQWDGSHCLGDGNPESRWAGMAVLEEKTGLLKGQSARRKSVGRELVFLLSPHVRKREILRSHDHEETAKRIIDFVDRALQELHVRPGREAHKAPARFTIVFVGAEKREEKLQARLDALLMASGKEAIDGLVRVGGDLTGRNRIPVANLHQERVDGKAPSHLDGVVVDDQAKRCIVVEFQGGPVGGTNLIVEGNQCPHLPHLSVGDGGDTFILRLLATVEEFGSLGDGFLHFAESEEKDGRRPK